MVIQLIYNNKKTKNKMKKHDTIIAIDPDVEKSGVAELIPQHRLLEVTNLTFPQLLDYLQARKKMSDTAHTSLVVVVEAGWLNKSNWHTSQNKATSAKVGNNTGRNHEVGRKIVEMCKHYGLEVVEQHPLRKCWKGKDGKITHDELAYFTGLIDRTNQDARDAALLAWNYAELPIKMKA
ncbi:hypothetical protein AGMMS49525_04910 [Bacteroidia bacterium]|nr:hypothetical protein AGMMS49525_04910 [Bacteroidia bacterium]